MPRAVLLCCGSRGDVEPFIALADALASSGRWEVVLAAPQDYAAQLPTHAAVTQHLLPFSLLDMVARFAPPAGDARPRDLPDALAAIVAELVIPQMRAVRDSLAGAAVDVVVTSYLTRPLALALARKERAHTVVVQLQPQAVTGDFPHHFISGEETAKAIFAAGAKAPSESTAAENRLSYERIERQMFGQFQGALEQCCRELAVDCPSIEDILRISEGNDASVTVFNSFPACLAPPCSDAGEHVVHVGPLADAYIPMGWEPAQLPDGLAAFLCEGPAPAVVGFGSMTIPDSASVESKLLRGLRQAGQERAVFVHGVQDVTAYDLRAAGAGAESGDASNVKQVFPLGGVSVPYAWLLPQCDIVVCHGGAGVISAALRAGRPLVVSPVMADQFMWAALVALRGLGSRVAPGVQGAGEDDIVAALTVARSAAVRAACKTAMAGERASSCQVAVEKLETLV